jgi:hypothetical protein
MLIDVMDSKLNLFFNVFLAKWIIDGVFNINNKMTWIDAMTLPTYWYLKQRNLLVQENNCTWDH